MQAFRPKCKTADGEQEKRRVGEEWRPRAHEANSKKDTSQNGKEQLFGKEDNVHRISFYKDLVISITEFTAGVP